MPGTMGLLTIDQWNDYYRNGLVVRVLFNGHDITERCMASDDRQGWVLVLRKRNGRAFVDTDRLTAAKALLTGRVDYLVQTR